MRGSDRRSSAGPRCEQGKGARRCRNRECGGRAAEQAKEVEQVEMEMALLIGVCKHKRSLGGQNKTHQPNRPRGGNARVAVICMHWAARSSSSSSSSKARTRTSGADCSTRG